MIRAAGAEDAAALAGVQVRGWWHGYAGFVDHEHLAQQTVAARTQRWRELLDGAGRHTAVAEVEGRVAGFASVGAPRLGHPDPRAGELYAIYVDPPAQGAGVGTALLADAEERLRDLGFERALLAVFEQNGLARAFYRARGWREEEPRVLYEDRWAPEIHMLKELI